MNTECKHGTGKYQSDRAPRFRHRQISLHAGHGRFTGGPEAPILTASCEGVTTLLQSAATSSGQAATSTVRQQERSSRRQYFFQVRQDLLDDQGIFDTGNDLRCSSADSVLLSVNIENPLQPLRLQLKATMCSAWRVTHCAHLPAAPTTCSRVIPCITLTITHHS